MSRDPAEERGGKNLYGFVRNKKLSLYDAFGLCGTGGSGDPNPDKCGPDVTAAVEKTLTDVKNRFLDDDNPNFQPGDPDTYRRNACMTCYQQVPPLDPPNTAWEISFLGALGGNRNIANFNTQLLPSGWTTANLGTGPCTRTVVYRGQCVWAGALNYVLFGKINTLCHDKFASQPFGVLFPGGWGFTLINWSVLDMNMAILYHKEKHCERQSEYGEKLAV